MQYWDLELFQKIGKECREFIFLAAVTFSRSRMDDTTMLVSSSLNPILKLMDFTVKGNAFWLGLWKT